MKWFPSPGIVQCQECKTDLVSLSSYFGTAPHIVQEYEYVVPEGPAAELIAEITAKLIRSMSDDIFPCLAHEAHLPLDHPDRSSTDATVACVIDHNIALLEALRRVVVSGNADELADRLRKKLVKSEILY
jgi:hypothetical protein